MNANTDVLYRKIYSKVLSTGGIGFVSKIIDKKLDLRAFRFVDTILELGSGEDQNFELVTQESNQYLENEILLSNLPSRPQSKDKTVERIALDAEDLRKILDNSMNCLATSDLSSLLWNPEKALQE